jgi:hypothetical protein
VLKTHLICFLDRVVPRQLRYSRYPPPHLSFTIRPPLPPLALLPPQRPQRCHDAVLLLRPLPYHACIHPQHQQIIIPFLSVSFSWKIPRIRYARRAHTNFRVNTWLRQRKILKKCASTNGSSRSSNPFPSVRGWLVRLDRRRPPSPCESRGNALGYVKMAMNPAPCSG